MSQSSENRKRAVQVIMRRNMLERRIKKTQQRLVALEGEARYDLEDSLLADQAALSKAIPTLEAFKADFRQEEERIRRKTQEALRIQEELRSRQFPTFPGGNAPPSPGQTLGFLVILAAIAAIASGVLLLLK